MKIRIHDGSPHEAGVVYLALVEAEPDHIMLAAVDQGGNVLADAESEHHGGTLLTVTAAGTIALSPAVMPELGFQLDIEQRPILDQFCERETARRAQRFGGKRAAFRLVEDKP